MSAGGKQKHTHNFTTIVVTGASKGIGLAFVRKYAQRPNYLVIAGAHDASGSELQSLANGQKNIRILPLDVSSDQSVEQFAKSLADHKETCCIDVLINNAGISYGCTDISESPSNLLEAFNVNCVGAYRMARALLPLLKKSDNPRIINVTSDMGVCDHNELGKHFSYRISKAALNMLTKTLSIDLKDDNIIVSAIHPGYVKTDMTQGQGDVEPDEAVEKLSLIVDKLKLEDSGQLHHREGHIIHM